MGKYGKVYRGCIDDRSINVAIKRLIFRSEQGFHDYGNEVVLLCQLSHPNLVPLIGYCMDEPEMILVYEFMVNGTLSEHLYGTDNLDPLPWKQRLQICVAVARGLHYLHAGVKHTIIHGDVKSVIILLDEKWEAKLSAFGLSKIGPPSLSNKALIRMESAVRGTLGYLDPEYAQSQVLTDKSDIYSFGVVLLEILCGRKAYDHREEQRNLVQRALKFIREGTINQIIDPYLMGKIAPECFKIYMDIATSCVRTQGTQRPTIGEVEAALEHALQMQESKDMDPGIGGADQYMYPVGE